ncbi:MAG: tRNA pseudouridine(38-40) synthase TruA [Candidatus Omnitrophica bacterium]|nr:tRNA pseudouridine(38-40) synthase TruA [Candidatus Omnitrophota bacterium]
MRNIKLAIQYDGTNYAGWQFQKNAKAIQEVIEARLKKLTGDNVNLIGSGRTDAGVHAKGQIANFKTGSLLPIKNIQKGLNTILPKDIVITKIEEAALDFNSQRAARSKMYRYAISPGDFVDPFIRRFTARCQYRLSIGYMKRGARYLLGRHDFRSFQTKDEGNSKNSAIRTVREIRIEKEGRLVYIYIEADGFLYNMARSIVGTLIEVGRGKIAPDRIRDILSKKDRRFCGPTAPAKGLCLMKVGY